MFATLLQGIHAHYMLLNELLLNFAVFLLLVILKINHKLNANAETSKRH